MEVMRARARANSPEGRAAARLAREDAAFLRIDAYLKASERALAEERRVTALHGVRISHAAVEAAAVYHLGVDGCSHIPTPPRPTVDVFRFNGSVAWKDRAKLAA